MNVVYVAPFGLGQKSTVWARTLPLAAQVVDAGHRASIVIPPWDTPADANTHTRQMGVPLIQVDTRGGLPFIWRRMLAAIHDLQPDVVHIVKPRAYAGLVQWSLWQRRRLPAGESPRILLDVDDWEQAWAPINGYPIHVARFLAWQEEWGIRHADAITAASRWLVERVHTYTPGTPALYLPNGVNSTDGGTQRAPTHLAPLGREETGQQILYFTRFVEVESDWLARFWQALRSRCPECRLIVAGNALVPGREESFKAAMHTLGHEDNTSVSWLGHVHGKSIDRLYAQVDCAVFPATEEPLQQAKCSVRLATTLIHGVPVVASAVGEQAGYGGGGSARLVAADAAPETFAAIVSDLLADGQARSAMIEHARDRLLTQYSWRRLGRSLIDFYEETTGDRA